MNSLRWGLIGTSEVSRGFARALARVPGHVRQAVVSRDATRALAFAREFGFRAALPLMAESFASADIDVFHIATPTATHRELALACIAAGKPIVCEKPMTASPTELEEVLAAARRQGVFAMEGMWLRFSPVIAQCRAALDSGVVGEVLAVDMQVGYREQELAAVVRDGPARDALAVFGCYGFSLAHDLFGLPGSVLATARHDRAGAVLHCDAVLRYPGFAFRLTSSIVADTANRLEITGTQGRLAIPAPVLDPYRLDVVGARRSGLAAKLGQRASALRHALGDQFASLHPLRGSGFRHEIEAVGACLGRGELECAVNPHAATRAAHALQQAVRRALDAGAQGWCTMSASSF